ncbi:hypothetical protein AKO1_007571 [Acrasis kona]|uniref:Uncharacterized protein n=1 Tax=Acrasis kona TaxID=1008807 RepID=A0AAW2YR83_9EUKA
MNIREAFRPNSDLAAPDSDKSAGLFSFNKYPEGVRHSTFHPYVLADHESQTANKYTQRN